eukprot:TRINITY_DN6618_c0_g1_i10.p1 TRINITY_DN6618_c0_g1~~TRINITY_DN6618_c0_g1_i10.p1  ORF type:complete len:124 (+),score=16.97 TRINITY_DN6618_c0_g1_i10:136-507(+)
MDFEVISEVSRRIPERKSRFTDELQMFSQMGKASSQRMACARDAVVIVLTKAFMASFMLIGFGLVLLIPGLLRYVKKSETCKFRSLAFGVFVIVPGIFYSARIVVYICKKPEKFMKIIEKIPL